MKAIILAAGMGTRLGNYTKDLPKGMLMVNGKPLLQHQIETLRKAGIGDITIVKGYKPEKIAFEGIKYYLNPYYQNTNMVESLFSAQQEFTDDLIVCYADIIYESKVIEKVIGGKGEIGVTVDADYWDYWKARLEKPEDDVESLVVDAQGDITELGTPHCPLEKAKCRYVGLIRFSKAGLGELRAVYQQNKQKYFAVDKPWMNSKSFKKAYMTDMLQALIDAGCKVKPIIIRRGWLEFDTVEDIEKVTLWIRQGSLGRFFSFDS